MPEEASKACEEMFSVAFRCKRLPVPHCAPVQWVKQTVFIQEWSLQRLSPFLLYLESHRLKAILHSYETEH